MKTPTNNNTWIEEAAYQEENNFWIRKSQKIALKILMHLKKEKISQVQLAERLGVSAQQINKIVRGKSNLTLETICKIEKELNTEFIVIPDAVPWSRIVEANRANTQLLRAREEKMDIQTSAYGDVYESLRKITTKDLFELSNTGRGNRVTGLKPLKIKSGAQSTYQEIAL